MRDLRRNSCCGELENSHGDVFHKRRSEPRVSESWGGFDPRVVGSSRGSPQWIRRLLLERSRFERRLPPRRHPR
jgi:hypothetical protein